MPDSVEKQEERLPADARCSTRSGNPREASKDSNRRLFTEKVGTFIRQKTVDGIILFDSDFNNPD